MSIFSSEQVIIHKIQENDLSAFLVGFDLSDNGTLVYRLKLFVNQLLEALVDFAFGTHLGETMDNSEALPRVKESAKAIYSIDSFKNIKELCDQDKILEDDIDNKYLKRGEFGELILHLLLRDFFNTIPLLSKIYFKDADGSNVHGFDAVHIEPDSKTLWLGESKLYEVGRKGVLSLIKDMEEHIKKDYLEREFALISKKLKINPSQDKEYWIKLMDNSTKLSEQISYIVFPLLCTYTSDNFTKYNDETTSEFITAYENEIRGLKKIFDEKNKHPLKSKIKFILILFPIQSKLDFLKKIHNKLSLLQEALD